MNESQNRRGVNWPVRLYLPLALAAFALLVTGCPHNEYIVQLKPQGDSLERALVFYCADGMNTNTGTPNYRNFDAAELDAITGLYPAGGVTHEGLRYTARGGFTNQLPSDVGGAGAYIHTATSLGEAGFYTERFRGNDDFAGMTERHFKAADRLADLVIGWTHTELWREPGYGQLRRFLDGNFRRDLKNLSAYWWEGQLASGYKTNAYEEFIVRFGQYLWERGYFKTEDIPVLFRAATDNDSPLILSRIQRLVADKMGVPETNPVPESLAFMAGEKTLENSFDNYLSGTELYRAKLQQWEEARKLNPKAKRPEPDAVLQDALSDLVEFELFEHPDRLTVCLSLASPPVHSNGRWDEARKQVVWETDLEGRTNAAHIPFACYASWALPDEGFQKAHFGKIALAADELTQYCLWRSSLDAHHGAEWDTFISSLQPGAELMARVKAFRFSGEPVTVTNQPQNASGLSACPRDLLQTALQ